MTAKHISMALGTVVSVLLGRIACTECKDAASCYRCGVVCPSLCVVSLKELDATVSPTKTDDPIDMRCGMKD